MTTLSSKFPHPSDFSWQAHLEAMKPVEQEQKARIRKFVGLIQARDPMAYDELRKFAEGNQDDLGAIESKVKEALDNLIAAMDDVDDLVDAGCRPAVAAAMSIEAMARAEFVASLS